MTFFHFVNCSALALAPFAIVYKYSGLSEYSSIWRCVQAAIAYMFTQLVKLLFIATFLPTSELEGQQFDLSTEILKSSADFIDLCGLYLIMQYGLVGKGEIRFITAGLGWSGAEALATRIVPFWVGARGIGFDWKYICMAFESSFNMLHWFATAAMIWLFVRYDLPTTLKNLCALQLTYAIARTLIYASLANGVQGLLLLILMKLAITVVECTLALLIYCSVTRPVAQ